VNRTATLAATAIPPPVKNAAIGEMLWYSSPKSTVPASTNSPVVR